MTSLIRSVYVHAPFCARRCFYCDFAVTVSSEVDAGVWADTLALELAAVEREGGYALAERLGTLYVGGGTPSLLGPTAMERLAAVLGEGRTAAPGLEWTAEANPESFTTAVAQGWIHAGVNRLSLGVQTFHPGALQWMGRLHGADGARQAVATARGVGFTNISLDLIFGLPDAVGRSWADDLKQAIDLDVPHVSLYGLTVEARTPLGRAVSEGREPAVDEEQYRDEYLLAAELLQEAGYEHYEVSNFARGGLVSRHNSAYWDGSPYLGLGNGAHSYVHPVRRWNVRDWEDYRAGVLAGDVAEESREELTIEAADLERVWLGLRTREGLALAGLGPASLAVVRDWHLRGLADLESERVRLTPLGWLELDGLAVALDAVEELRA